MWYEAYELDGRWKWKIYHYDATGNVEVRVATSRHEFYTKEEAEDDCCEYQDEHNIDAALS